MNAFDARRSYEVWMKLIGDEKLYEATLAGRHAELAATHRLDAVDLALLDQFHKMPGIRWCMENLRCRAAGEVAGKLNIWMPLTISLLTQANDDWLQDTCYEYLAGHQWREFGNYHFAECKRFAAYVKDRVIVRRHTPVHLDSVLSFEMQVIELLERTARLQPAEWPSGEAPADDEQLAEVNPRRSPASALIELPVDISAWVRSGDTRTGTVEEKPSRVLVHVPSSRDKHKIQILGEGPHLIWSRCDGGRSADDIGQELEAEYEIEGSETFALIRRWITARALMCA